MEKVAVIISTYNGEKYIESQLNSILEQDYEDISIFVRDDGSTDRTRYIIKEMADNNNTSKDITIIDDDLGNIGFAESFKRILKCANGFDYYALCDQDDFWLRNKISSAVDCLCNYSKEVMVLYSSNYWICDSELNKVGEAGRKIEIGNYTLGKVFMEGLVPGFSMVFNQKLKNEAFSGEDFSIVSHDKWISTIIVGLQGVFFYDEEPRVLYRRHSNTASATNQNFLERVKWKIKNVVRGDFYERTNQLINQYYSLFFDRIVDDEDRRFIAIFASNNKFKKIMYNKRLRKIKLDEFLLRVLILLRG